METQPLILVEEFCRAHLIEEQFLAQLMDSGLVDLVIVHERNFISLDQVPRAEKFIRLFYELDINLAGLEVLAYLLPRIDGLKQEVDQLKNQLDFYLPTPLSH